MVALASGSIKFHDTPRRHSLLEREGMAMPLHSNTNNHKEAQ